MMHMPDQSWVHSINLLDVADEMGRQHDKWTDIFTVCCTLVLPLFFFVFKWQLTAAGSVRLAISEDTNENQNITTEGVIAKNNVKQIW